MLRAKQLRTLYWRVYTEADQTPPRADLAYLFGQTKENQASVLDVAPNFSGPIGIVGDEGTEASGYPGFSAWKRELIARGIGEERILGIPGTFSADREGVFRGNTLTEAAALVRLLRERRMESVVIVATYWHLLRCVMTTVGMALREYPELKIYPAHGASLPWDEVVPHSQGRTMGSRADLMAEEIFRLLDYHEQDEIPAAENLAASIPEAEEVLAYFDKRG